MLSQKLQPLSRITVGHFEDLGYKVNYEAADKFTKADLNQSCLCPSKPPSTSAILAEVRNVMKPKLSDEGKGVATEFGRSVLLKSRTKSMAVKTKPTTMTYVIYEEKGHLHFVYVTL